MGSRLTPFGVAVIQEMNRLGMMVGVSHLSANGVFQAAEVSKQPIVSTHQNLERFVKSRPQVEIMDEEAKVIANTSGREVEGRTSRTYTGVEAQTMHEHWDSFIKMLSERGFTDDQIGLIVGGNYLRIWKQILPVT